MFKTSIINSICNLPTQVECTTTYLRQKYIREKMNEEQFNLNGWKRFNLKLLLTIILVGISVGKLLENSPSNRTNWSQRQRQRRWWRRHFEMTFDARMPTSNIVFFFLFDDDVDESDSCMSNEQKEEFDEDEEDDDKHLHLYTRVDTSEWESQLETLNFDQRRVRRIAHFESLSHEWNFSIWWRRFKVCRTTTSRMISLHLFTEKGQLQVHGEC